MEEDLRKQFHEIWRRCHDGEISREERNRQYEALIRRILEENPQRLLDLCTGHISGLPDERLLQMAKNEAEDFVFMNISAGAYNYVDVSRGSAPSSDAEAVEAISRRIFALLGLDAPAIRRLLKKARGCDDYDRDPAGATLDMLTEEELCACIDWKFGLEDVEYNLNLAAKRLGMEAIREYPPYEEGQPLGFAAVEEIIRDCPHAAAVIPDGDELYVFLISREKAPELAEELNKLQPYLELDDAFVLA